jgi:hypothetical protein
MVWYVGGGAKNKDHVRVWFEAVAKTGWRTLVCQFFKLFFLELHRYTHADPIPKSTSERLCRHISRLTKSPQVSRYRRKHRLPLIVQCR